jgi:hypothetical protein
MRLAISSAIAVSRPSAVSSVETVGSDSSSFTNGSSVESVAGKNRAPGKAVASCGKGQRERNNQQYEHRCASEKVHLIN